MDFVQDEERAQGLPQLATIIGFRVEAEAEQLLQLEVEVILEAVEYSGEEIGLLKVVTAVGIEEAGIMAFTQPAADRDLGFDIKQNACRFPQIGGLSIRALNY